MFVSHFPRFLFPWLLYRMKHVCACLYCCFSHSGSNAKRCRWFFFVMLVTIVFIIQSTVTLCYAFSNFVIFVLQYIVYCHSLAICRLQVQFHSTSNETNDKIMTKNVELFTLTIGLTWFCYQSTTITSFAELYHID